jgi:hypothetical protein
MFEKMLFSGKTLYFRCAPPLTDLDEISDDELPNRPYPQAKKHERSVYFYWWAYLRENEAYMACCDAGGTGPMSDLFADFGDVRGGSFMDWWMGGARLLFCEPPEAEIITYPTVPREYVSADRVLLSVPVTGDIDRTMAELRKTLQEAFAFARRQRQQQNTASESFSRARYPVFTKPVLTSLHERLITLRARNANPSATLYEIGKITGMVDRTSGEKNDADHRNRVSASVSRYLREARALVHNVGEGRFPDVTKPQSASENSANGKTQQKAEHTL